MCDVGYLTILDFLGLSVIDLGPMYTADRQTSESDRRQITSSFNASPRRLLGAGHKKE